MTFLGNKGATVIAFLALIVGIGGLGLGLYQFLFPAEPEKTGIQNTWFESTGTFYYTDPISTDIPVDELEIEFTVNSGESVYCISSFNVWLDHAATSVMRVNFELDGANLRAGNEPWHTIQLNDYSLGSTVTIQHSIDGLTAGTHTLTIVISGSNVNNYITDSSLLVQTYIP